MYEKKQALWTKYLDNKHYLDNHIITIGFSGNFFQDYPVYSVRFYDELGDIPVFFWFIIAMDDCWILDHTREIIAPKIEGEFIPRVYNHQIRFYKKYFDNIRKLMSFLKYPLDGYEKNFATFLILCFRKGNYHMPIEMILFILSFMRRADIKEKKNFSIKKKYIWDHIYDFFSSLINF